jgi:tRNA U34 5-methylaminomethyl-2-thiouridine-forming methyltransferase MnmC
MTLKRVLKATADGSKTLYIPEWNESYHSKHGAIQEAYHVFIKNGLDLFKNKSINILEMGFGTGLNCLITMHESNHRNFNINYTGIEKFPLTLHEINALNYCKKLTFDKCTDFFEKIHLAEWEQPVAINPQFTLNKQQKDFTEVYFTNTFDLIYYDCFGARVQPELWTEVLFTQMFQSLKKGGVFVTYAAKGSVRRAMQEVGFAVERLPGPPGKREMLRGKK